MGKFHGHFFYKFLISFLRSHGHPWNIPKTPHPKKKVQTPKAASSAAASPEKSAVSFFGSFERGVSDYHDALSQQFSYLQEAVESFELETIVSNRDCCYTDIFEFYFFAIESDVYHRLRFILFQEQFCYTDILEQY